MSLLGSIRDGVFAQVARVATSERVTRLVGDPRVMNVAMKAMSLGGAVKSNMDRAGRIAAGVFGLATQEEVATLRSTIQTLEDTIASLEAQDRTAAPDGAAAASPRVAAEGAGAARG